MAQMSHSQIENIGDEENQAYGRLQLATDNAASQERDLSAPMDEQPPILDDAGSVKTFSDDDVMPRDSMYMRGRQSFAEASRMSMEFVADVAHHVEYLARDSIQDIKEAVGTFHKSYFADWTKRELILVLVQDGYNLVGESTAFTPALRQIAKERFEAKGRFPTKPNLPNEQRQLQLEASALTIQKAWIKYFFLQRDQVLVADYAFTDRDSDEDEMEWEIDVYMDDMSVASDQPTADIGDIEMNITDISTDPQNTAVDSGVTSPESTRPRSFRKPTPSIRKHVPKSLDTSLPWKEPSLSKAIANADKYHPRVGQKKHYSKYDWLATTTGRHCVLGGPGEQCDLWAEGTVSQFSKYGPGISNYFKFLKWCFWLFICLSIIQSVAITFNTFGKEHIAEGTSVDYIFSTTVGNLGDSNQTYAVDLPGCRSGAYHEADCEIMKEDIAVLYSTINAFAAVMIIVAFVWLRIFELREVMVLDKNTISASDFTVTVENLPASCTAKNLKSHFQKLTKFHIVDVRLAYDDEEDILLFFERGSLFRHRRNLVEMYRYQKMIGKQKEQYFKNLMKDINQVTLKIQKIEGVLAKHLQKKVKKKKLPAPLFAYITFEQSVGAHRAIQIYRDSWLTYWFMDEKRRFQGCRLKVHKSPQPSVIIWENLGYSAWHRFRRRALTWIISIALLVLSAICSFTSRAFEQRAQNAGGQEPCPEGFDSLSKEDQRSYAKDNPGTEHCYCSNFDLEEQSQDSFCQSYYRAQAIAGAFTYTTAFAVVLINGGIDYILKKCAVFEKHHTIDDLELSVFLRMFILKFINSGALFLLSNANVFLKQIFGQQYDERVDFTPEWFATVGVNIMLVQLGDIIMPHAWKFYRYFTFHLKQKSFKSSDPTVALHQRELDELFMGPDFLLSTRYAQIMSNLYICMIFSTGMPVLVLIAVLNFYVSYWVDKYLFTNFYRTPPYYDGKIGQKATSMIPYAVLIYLGVAVWTLGNREIFRTKNNDQYSSYYSDYEPGNVSQKISQRHVIPLFALFVAVLVSITLGLLLSNFAIGIHIILNGLCGGYLSRYEMFFELQQYMQSNINLSYKRALRRHVMKGLHTYKMFENPKYRSAFNLTNKIAKMHDDVSSIRFIESGSAPGRAQSNPGGTPLINSNVSSNAASPMMATSPTSDEQPPDSSAGASRRRQSHLAMRQVDLTAGSRQVSRK